MSDKYEKSVKNDVREIMIYGLIGFGFLACQIVGRDLAAETAGIAETARTTQTVIGNIEWNPGYVLRTMAVCLCGGGGFGGLCLLADRLWQNRRERGRSGNSAVDSTAGEAKASGIRFRRPNRIWLVSFLLIFLCWLPGYLAYYPGICAYDVTIQTGQIISGAYNDHHPIFHTLLIAGAMKLGQTVFSDVNTGIGLLILLQMSLLAAVLSGGIRMLYRWGVCRKWLVCLQAFCMLYPFHLYMSVSLSKDVFFSVFFVLQMFCACEMIRRRGAKPDRFDVMFFLASVGMQLFRNNGRYAMLVLLVVLAAAVVFGKRDRRFWAKMLGNCVLALCAGSFLLAGVFRAVHAEQGDRREMLSMPIEQLARCMLFHGGVGELSQDDATMDEASKALINDFLLEEGYRAYRPEISDPVKNHTNTYVVRYRSREFAKTYLRLLGSYPGDFINAAYAVNAGYLYLGDVSHATVNQNGKDKGLGYIQTRWVTGELNPRGIYQDSKWEWLRERMEKWADDNAYLKLWLLKYLFVPGTFLWLYLLLAGYLAVRRAYGGYVPLALVFGYYLTLFFGPVVQLRYLYPLMVALPFAVLYLTAGRGSRE